MRDEHGPQMWGFKLDLKPKHANAQMIERHNALLRDALCHIDGQMMRDGIAVPPQAILDKALLAKNCLISPTTTTASRALHDTFIDF
eukprot:5575709-Heterocapsa_arctica.AAC.1